MDLAPTGAVLHGLSEIAVLDQGGHFLGLERSYGFQGFALKLYQLASGGATDISAIASLRNGSGIDRAASTPSAKNSYSILRACQSPSKTTKRWRSVRVCLIAAAACW